MKATEFAYWLQGFFEVAEPKEMTAKQVDMVKNHLALVFKHEIDPSYSKDPKVQKEMNDIHTGKLPSIFDRPKPNPFNTGTGMYPQKFDGGEELMRC